MHVIYDVSHNIAKVEEHMVDGRPKTLLVHRKGSTRAFPPHHPLIPVDYQLTGQPVLVGGTMGTCSYVLTGTEKGMSETFGSTCHGAVSVARALYYLTFCPGLAVLPRFCPDSVPVLQCFPDFAIFRCMFDNNSFHFALFAAPSR